MPPLPFDRVRVQEDPTPRDLTIDEFLAIPLHRRVTWMLERRLSFFRGPTPVDPREALSALRATWTRESQR